MKIWQLNTFCGIKSTGRIATDIALLLEKEGHVCRVGYGAESAPESLQRFAYRVGGKCERKIHGAIRKFLDGEGYGSQLGTFALIRELKRFQPDVVHLHNVHGCYVNLPLLFGYLQKSGVPVVWTLHDGWVLTGHCAYFEYAKCFRWKKACGHCPQLRSYPTCLWWDGSKRNLRRKQKLFSSVKNLTLVTPCQWLGQYVTQSYLGQKPTRVIPNGVNPAVFRPVDGRYLRERYQISAKYVVLSVAAEWDERKGLGYLLEASKELGTDYQCVVIGLLKAQIEALPASIIGIEATSNVQELAAWYSLADCLANPTLEDNMPMVNLEALACGTPVAVFQTGGCPEAVEESCGKVVAQGDAKALGEAIKALAPQKAERTEACLKRARHFEAETCYRQYLELYKELAP